MTPETTLDLQQLASREDVLSVLSQVERSIGLLRVHADEEAQRAAESERLSREFASLEDERARLLERQCALESQLAAARGTLSEFERRVRDAEACASDANRRAQTSLEECARIEGEALSLSLAHDEELRQEREAQRHAFAARTEELQRGYEARVEELERALAEHAATGRSQDALGAELCAVQAELDALRAEAAARRSDDEALRTEAEARCIELEAALAETRAALATMESRVVELSARVDECAARETEYAVRVNEYAAREAEYAARVNEYAARETEHEARMQDYAARAAESTACAHAATERLAAVEAELCAERARHANFSPENSATPTTFVAPLDEAQRAASFDSAVEARAGELAAERVQQLLAPKLAGLAQAAAFLKTRRERLAALRSGLKRRARELKVEREALAAMPAQNLESIDRGFEVGDAESGELATVRAERAALASEKQEIVDLRAILEASEASLARRAAGTRITTTVALSLGFSAVAALASWHLAGALSPTPALAQVELAVSSRAPEAQQRGAASEASADVAEAGSTASSNQGARIEQWIDARVADESFAGVVAGRLLDRGRTRAESDALAASFADRLSVESSDSTVRLALRGDGLEQTSATLDAIATSIVTEANRDPARRSDFLRVGIANAKQEIGRTVFAHAEPLPDPERLARAGGFFGGFLAVAAVVVGVFAIFARRTAALATQGY